MMRLKSKLMSMNASKTAKVKILSPKNCEEIRIPFKADKTAKVVGKLAANPPPIQDGSDQLITGVLVQNDFRMSLMAAEDLREYAGLTTTTITCKQRMTLSAAGIDLIKWALEGTFGSIDELPESKKKANGDTHMNGSTEDADEEISNETTVYLVMGCVTVRYSNNGEVELEWEGNMLNDGIADAIMAVLFSVESSPAAVKRWLPFLDTVGVANTAQNHQANTPTRTSSQPRIPTRTSRPPSVWSGSSCSSKPNSAPRI
jgi:cleavage and polyadenylation specificity factor subunit 3